MANDYIVTVIKEAISQHVVYGC